MKFRKHSSLTLTLRAGDYALKTVDFDCYNFRGFPAKRYCSSSERILRPVSAETLFIAFRDAEYAEAIKYYHYSYLRKYVAFCDICSTAPPRKCRPLLDAYRALR